MLHIQIPVQQFLEKMKVKEDTLAMRGSPRSFNAVRTQLHWSLVARKGVEELRKTVISALMAINVLLGVQQLSVVHNPFGRWLLMFPGVA